MRTPTAYDSGRRYAESGLTPNWSALWISGRLAEFNRGYEAGLAERRPLSAKPGAILVVTAPRRSGRG